MHRRLCGPILLLAVLAGALADAPAIGQRSEGELRNRIDAARDRERSLAGSVARLGRLERATAREVAILERRVAAAQAELAQAERVLAATVQRRDRQRARALRLRARLGESRAQLAKLLRQRYTGGRPDIVTVVLHADGFARLLETVDFLKRIQAQDERILATVRVARRDALAQRRVLTKLAAQRQAAADAVRRRHTALAAIAAGLHERRAALAQARRTRAALLRGTRASRRRAQRSLDRLLAQRARALRAVGPGGPWAIPWPVVQCESGGQNLPPNSAGASGFYQFLPDTWRGLGGSTPHAHLAPKAEQDRLAAQLWNGGRGAHNWVCAALVGSA
ncbi:MAG TPA: transglycosylase family protein [Solirubrobacteraceae bacterium]|nr:transglycosylase family protein [Solirubrobacteraceae bacterium]